MTEHDPDRSRDANPWKVAFLAIGGLLLALVAGGAVIGALSDSDSRQSVASTASHPPASAIEDCNRYAAESARDTKEVIKDGVIGGAVGAGVGAAGGAIADGGDGAGKGAGIGAIVGVTAGTLYGLNEENRRTEAARNAYRACMDRRGYSG